MRWGAVCHGCSPAGMEVVKMKDPVKELAHGVKSSYFTAFIKNCTTLNNLHIVKEHAQLFQVSFFIRIPVLINVAKAKEI